ncbi:unnamed protein product [Sphenostylis stenocarpa]|uniref:Uncharacterized protein n=1 Tax=Sphenostylis stenocarpa TaxID=92480 RepID=A0AA86VCC8_9FABA|nr:unnamed protein product [Sphenostylis stenocarpa]
MQGQTIVWCSWTTICPQRPLMDDRLPPTNTFGRPSAPSGRPSGPNGHPWTAGWLGGQSSASLCLGLD